MRKILSLLLVGLLYSALSFGQTKVISGKITDKQGVPVPFVTVTVKGDNRGTSADVNGQFSISVKKGDVLVMLIIDSEQLLTDIALDDGGADEPVETSIRMRPKLHQANTIRALPGVGNDVVDKRDAVGRCRFVAQDKLV